MLIVGDDISLPDNKHPRGIAGTILVHKIAGYYAEHGNNLATVLREAQYAANNTVSLGVALSVAIYHRMMRTHRVFIPDMPSWEWASMVNQVQRSLPPRTAQRLSS
jgi:hypothetical protein